jgi:type I restriction enzyme S subunit
MVTIPLPPIDEQRTIVKYLEETTSKIDTLIAKAQQAIELQKEHRTALISAAVTGKIDVRGMVQQEVSEAKAA